MTIFLAIVIGLTFGIALDRIGATNPKFAVKTLNLTNMHLAKTIVLAIGFASVIMFTGQMAGLIDVGHMSVKAAYLGVFFGGIIMGTGWAITGYCPGTGLSAAASGRKDALFFIAGGLLGALAYMVSYAWIKSTGILDKLWGGKVTLGTVPDSGYTGVIEGLPGDIAGIVLGFAFIAIAFALPNNMRRTPHISGVPAE